MGNLQSTSSSNNTNIKYDVFLSFRGEDTRGGFTSHLYAALRRKKIETFIDNRLIRGDDISPALSRAIEESKISVVIFSKDYASSKWCLRELVEIMKHENKNNQIVIPVFYGVDPSDVRKQTGSFKNSIDKHGKELPEEVQTWREALTKASNKSGWHSSLERTDAALVLKIVNDIWKRLMGQYISPGFGGLIGLERIKRITSLLRLVDRTNVLIIGIWGMGGIGKTTLADAIFNQNSKQFEGVCCFIQNVRERLENSGGLASLKKEILSKVLQGEKLELDGPTIPQKIKERLNRTRVFIVLDDVDDFLRIEPLFKGVDGLGKGSRILITSRNRHVLQNCCVNDCNIYEVKGLANHEALQLFHSYAFKDSCPSKDFKVLSEKFVDYAKGNPLALKVLGSSLYQKRKQEWESAANTLLTNLDREIYDVLKISFDGLDYREKNAFLDIACFLKGEKREYVAKILDDCDYSLSVLIGKSLITISWDDSIQMHDLIQEMGRKIVHNESPDEVGKRSRLWRQEDVLNTLKRDDGTNAVQGIVLDMSKIKDIHLSPQAFKKMYNLRLLKFFDCTWIEQHSMDFNSYHSKVHFGGGQSDLFDKLRSLIWLGYPLPTLPSNFNLDNLVELDLSRSNVERLWEDTMPAPKLKWLLLAHCTRLTKIPDLSESPLIEKLDIRHCRSLLDFPPLAQHVNNLRDLFMQGCESLRSFPSDIHFKSISSLDLRGYKNITKFPEISGNITHLDLSWTAIDEVLPSIQCLTKLRKLNLSHCTRLQHIPTSICKLKSLYELNLENCSGLESFPEILDTMECLSDLKLSGTAIAEVPPSIQCLTKLRKLNLSQCTRLRHIPTSICKLKILYELNLENCSGLESFPEILDTMECLTDLKLSGTAIKELPENLGDLKSLTYLSADRSAISQLPSSMKHLKNLENLSCLGCRGLRFTHSSGLPCSLTSLCLSNSNLIEIPEDICRLTSLSYLDLSENHFEHLPKSMKQLCALEYLYLNNCNMLQSLTELPSRLQHLIANDCKQLRSIPDASEFAEIIRKQVHSNQFIFTNCLKLKAAVGNMLAQLRKYKESSGYCFCYSGSEVPGWFIFRTEESSIKLGVPEWHKFFSGQFRGIAVCAVIAFEKYCYNGDSEYQSDFKGLLKISYTFRTKNFLWGSDDIMVAGINKTFIDSDHVALWYQPLPFLPAEFTGSSFEFSLSKNSHHCRVKYCGLCPIYANQDIWETSGTRIGETSRKRSRTFYEIKP